jgi:hypothetical protein
MMSPSSIKEDLNKPWGFNPEILNPEIEHANSTEIRYDMIILYIILIVRFRGVNLELEGVKQTTYFAHAVVAGV